MSAEREAGNRDLDGEAEIRSLVAVGEDVPNPLDGLVDKSRTEAGYPFLPHIITALEHLKNCDRSAYETLRAQLKRVGVRVTDLDAEISRVSLHSMAHENEFSMAASVDLISSLDAMDFFHTPEGKALADITLNGHRATIAVESQEFEDHLTQIFFTSTAAAPSAEELRNAINVARARAKYDGPEREVHVRVAASDGKYFVDLCDDEWRAVEISRDGWRIVAQPLIRFVRYAGARALPEPKPGGSVDLLRRHVNLKDDDDFVLAIGWLLSALRPVGPYPVLALNGEQGTAKSTLSRCLRALVDPNAVPLRALPKNEHDLMISATRAHVIAADNISRISNEMSDALCRLSTGGGVATRSLYTDANETLLQAQRPILLNGIDDAIARPDLAQRTIVLELQPIPPSERRPAESIQKDFETDRGLILGALLDAMVHGLCHIDDVNGMVLPRMADSALWMTACEGAVWLDGTVASALSRNARGASGRLAERIPVVSALVELMRGDERWEGTASQLLAVLGRHTDEATRRSRDWPSNPARLGYMLQNRLRPLLRELGIEISGGPTGHERQRIIILERSPKHGRATE